MVTEADLEQRVEDIWCRLTLTLALTLTHLEQRVEYVLREGRLRERCGGEGGGGEGGGGDGGGEGGGGEGGTCDSGGVTVVVRGCWRGRW